MVFGRGTTCAATKWPKGGQKEARKSVPERVNDILEQRDAARTSLHGYAHRLGRELGTSSRMDDRRSFALTRAGGGRISWGDRFFGQLVLVDAQANSSKVACIVHQVYILCRT